VIGVLIYISLSHFTKFVPEVGGFDDDWSFSRLYKPFYWPLVDPNFWIGISIEMSKCQQIEYRMNPASHCLGATWVDPNQTIDYKQFAFRIEIQIPIPCRRAVLELKIIFAQKSAQEFHLIFEQILQSRL
jgi:hypothetical protein